MTSLLPRAPSILLVLLLATHALRIDSVKSKVPPPLPAALLVPPQPVDVLSNSIPTTPSGPELDKLKKLPRILIGYVSRKRWAFVEFLCMAHASWAHLNSQDRGRHKLDLLVFVDLAWADAVGSLCQLIDLNAPAGAPGSFAAVFKEDSQCLAVVYDVPPARIWHGYPYINNVHFFADPRVAEFLRGHYGYAMKTDWDVFLSPALLDHFPERFEFGVQEYVLSSTTSQRLKQIGSHLALKHKGQHNIGPTWYGPVETLLAIGNLSIPVLHHILTHEFEQKADGTGLQQDYMSGEGWPEWNAGIAAMYATEILVNGLMPQGSFQTTPKYDSHGDSGDETSSVYHIHCRHGDGDFSKFEFLAHHYDAIKDLSHLDTRVVRDYATSLAVKTWRELMRITQGAVKEL